jgi:hypothetical protein
MRQSDRKRYECASAVRGSPSLLHVTRDNPARRHCRGCDDALEQTYRCGEGVYCTREMDEEGPLSKDRVNGVVQDVTSSGVAARIPGWQPAAVGWVGS